MQVYYGNYYGTMVYCNIRIAYGLLCGSTMVYYGLLWYYEAFNSNTTELYGLVRVSHQPFGPPPSGLSCC